MTWSVGAERILGYKEEEILGHDFREIFTPHDIDKEQPQFELDEREKGPRGKTALASAQRRLAALGQRGRHAAPRSERHTPRVRQSAPRHYRAQAE